jgi:hypothetical protein
MTATLINRFTKLINVLVKLVIKGIERWNLSFLLLLTLNSEAFIKMPNFDGQVSKCYSNAIVRLDGVRLSCSSRAVDNGINATLYANDLNVILYTLINMRAGTITRLTAVCQYRHIIARRPQGLCILFEFHQWKSDQ